MLTTLLSWVTLVRIQHDDLKPAQVHRALYASSRELAPVFNLKPNRSLAISQVLHIAYGQDARDLTVFGCSLKISMLGIPTCTPDSACPAIYGLCLRHPRVPIAVNARNLRPCCCQQGPQSHIGILYRLIFNSPCLARRSTLLTGTCHCGGIDGLCGNVQQG